MVMVCVSDANLGIPMSLGGASDDYLLLFRCPLEGLRVMISCTSDAPGGGIPMMLFVVPMPSGAFRCPFGGFR